MSHERSSVLLRALPSAPSDRHWLQPRAQAPEAAGGRVSRHSQKERIYIKLYDSLFFFAKGKYTVLILP